MKTKKLLFWLLAIFIVAGHFAICRFSVIRLSLQPQDISPLIFGGVNLLVVVLISVFLLFMVTFPYPAHEAERNSLKGLWTEDKLIFIFIVVLIGFTPMLILFGFRAFGDAKLFDYPILFVVWPANYLFVFIVYKMFRLWLKIWPKGEKSALQPKTKLTTPQSGKKSVIWIGSKNVSILEMIQSEFDIFIWNDLTQIDRTRLKKFSSARVIVVHYTKSVTLYDIIHVLLSEKRYVVVQYTGKDKSGVEKLKKKFPAIVECNTHDPGQFPKESLSKLIHNYYN